MLKEKLQTAVADLKKVYTTVSLHSPTEDQIDIALEPAGMHATNGDLAALKILSANGLQAFGYVHSNNFKTLFLRNVQEVAPSSTLPAPSESQQ